MSSCDIDRKDEESTVSICGIPRKLVTKDTPLCPYYAAAGCCESENCAFVHGDVCDGCGLAQLHPVNERQRRQHRLECEEDIDIELDKECGICLEKVILKTTDTDDEFARMFGILENCPHCFCLSCIEKWRATREEHAQCVGQNRTLSLTADTTLTHLFHHDCILDGITVKVYGVHKPYHCDKVAIHWRVQEADPNDDVDEQLIRDLENFPHEGYGSGSDSEYSNGSKTETETDE
ncbi:E3 ubiquitin-protein ligase makorin-1 [Elysia marginata]|uniref:RING-type E3 ubiquitin transferase n=1 Tax=Elysia marginata TaxID=1093978 RepID=A0AAV4IYX3_9GAST|nr:E3 ubiquitin-protein ligase makorin-1 [Elysia marginata]